MRFLIQAVRKLIHQNIAQEYEIAQTRTGLYPVFGYSSKKGKLMWIGCPVEFVIHNIGKNRLSVLDHSSYYGYAHEVIYKLDNNPSKRWNSELIYRSESDSIGDYLDSAESISPNESKRYIIMPRIFVIRIRNFRSCLRIRLRSWHVPIRNPVGLLPLLRYPLASGSSSRNLFPVIP